MKYYLFKVGNKEYKLKLTAQGIIDVERHLGGSVFDVLMKTEKEKLPTLNELIIILYGSLKKYHNIGIEEVYGIYDEYIDNGGDYTGLIETVTEVLKVSGFFKETKKAEGETTAENVTEV